MKALVVPLAALVSGYGWSRAARTGRTGAARLTATVVLAVACTGLWMALLDMVHVTWTAGNIAAGFLPGLLLALVPTLRGLHGSRGSRRLREVLVGLRSHTPRFSPWTVVAVCGVAARALAVTAVPAFGWDFRYIWGLKARVFAMAGAHDFGWLATASHDFTHPGYPPLWPDLMAAGLVAGAHAAGAASAWSALLALGLGAACWELARPAGEFVAALAALAGAWFPTLMAPRISYSGSAELLVAFLFAASLVASPWRKGTTHSTLLLAASLGALAVTKNEGAVLALLVLVCVLPSVVRGRRAWLAVATVAPLSLWQLAVTAHGVPRMATVLDPVRMASRAAALPGVILSVMTPVLVLELFAVLLILAAPPFHGSRAFKLVVALWVAALAMAYLVSPYDLHWHLETSLQRVLAIPLPGGLALVLGAAARPNPSPLQEPSG